MEYIARVNLKTDCHNRKELIDFCLQNKEQYLAIEWSYVYSPDENKILSYQDYYYAVKRAVKIRNKRINPVHNIFWNAKEDDLFWTRDLEGNYWICRATGCALPYFDKDMDIGAVVPIEAYKVGMEVPGQIKASFNRPRGGTAEKIRDDGIVEYSKYVFNLKSGKSQYDYVTTKSDFLSNLPDFELEELVISYLQIKENYYLLSNSIANKSTTVKIECELISRDISDPRKAVVQVKGGHSKEVDALDYMDYVSHNYLVYLFAPTIINIDKTKNVIEITKDDLNSFYKEYKSILPESIVRWENLFV